MSDLSARADLQALIDITGLSIREAAAIIGVGETALSRKLNGAERYDVRQPEIDALADVAEYQNRQVATVLEMIDPLRRRHPGECRIDLLIYRHDADLPPDDLYPASVTRMIAARIKAQATVETRLILFDRALYDAWRGGAPDTRQARQEWAVHAARKTRLSLKIGEKINANSDRMSIGWAVWRTEPEPELVARGVTLGRSSAPKRKVPPSREA